VLAQEAAVDELQERARQVDGPELIRGDGLDGIEAEVAGEDAESHEQCPCEGAEEVEAPFDGRADRALTLREVAIGRVGQ
jgi:hypothetical protein